jgi:hypothetical protein
MSLYVSDTIDGDGADDNRGEEVGSKPPTPPHDILLLVKYPY